LKRFPCGRYGKQRLEFYPAPFRAPLRAFAALVFPWQDGLVLLCDIARRGWCIPSGRVEPLESSLEAAKREALEEGGAILGDVQYIGCYKIHERQEVRWADCYTARVDRLEEMPTSEESRGRRFVSMQDLPETYHVWNRLTDLVFRHAYEVLSRAARRKDEA
jgi:8-oxo-dGTP diphosphatase